MKRIYVCSPLASRDPQVVAENIARARAICRELVLGGDAAFAPHAFYTSFLRDEDPVERDAGVRAGRAWLPVADELLVCGDVVTPGMAREIRDAEEMGIVIRRRP